NTFNGGLEIQKGTVRATSAGALGTPASGIVGVTLKAAGLDFRTDTDLTFTHSVKVVPLTTSALTSTLNLDRLTAGTGRKVTLGTLTTDGAVTLNVTSATGCSAAFSGKAYFTDTGSGATIYTAGADLALTGGVSMTSGTLTKSGPQKLTLSGTQTYGSGTTLQVNAGALALNADAGSASKYNLALVTGGSAAVTFGASQHLARLELGGTGTATVASGGTTTVTTKNLIISGGTSPTAKLDLNDNHLVVNYAGGADPVDTVRGYLVAGYDGSTGLWTGQGIASSAAGVIQPATTLGYLDDPVTKTVAVKYTWLGDSNLDGVVDVDNDFSAFLDGLNGVGSGWNYGDYNYDGVVDVDNDFSMFLDGLNMQQGTLGWGGVTALADGIDPSALPAEQGAAGGSGFVPEPSTLVLMALGCAAMATRRRQAA
ncbi:MAG: PEP-CTERM sorting domain-containing protein, partial [Candidatus Hydrogenedentes bacterium]|nr:PEP-CTERM sorting domain-containing protein [Candidatus Hydrogenedentota bacterium]